MLQIVVTAVLARLLLPIEFGLVGAAAIIISFSNLFVQLGIVPALVQRPKLEQRHIDTGLFLSVLLGVLVGLLVFLTAPLVATAFQMEDLTPVLQVLSLGFVIQGPAAGAAAMMRRRLRFKALALVRFLGYLFGYGFVGLALAFLGFGVWALVGASLSQMLATTLMILAVERVGFRFAVNRAAARDLLSYGGSFTAGSVAGHLAENLDNAVVGRFLGAQALGYYGRAFQFLAAPSEMGSAAFDRVFFPVFAKVQLERERLSRAYRRSVVVIAILTIPLTVPLVLLAPEIVMVLLGPGWEPVIRPFQVLVVVLPLRLGAKIAKSIAKATGAVGSSAWRQGIFAGLVLLGSWIGSSWGLEGVAIGVLVATLLDYLLLAQLSLSKAGLSWKAFSLAHLPGVALAATWSAVALPLVASLRSWGFSDVVVIVLLCVVLGLSLPLLWVAWPRVFLGSDGRWALSLIRARFASPSG